MYLCIVFATVSTLVPHHLRARAKKKKKSPLSGPPTPRTRDSFCFVIGNSISLYFVSVFQPSGPAARSWAVRWRRRTGWASGTARGSGRHRGSSSSSRRGISGKIGNKSFGVLIGAEKAKCTWRAQYSAAHWVRHCPSYIVIFYQFILTYPFAAILSF